jgi:hypothetical protein
VEVSDDGTKDAIAPVKTCVKPMYELLGTDDQHNKLKRHLGGHGLSGLFSKQIRREVLDWLDHYLGPVE